MDRVAAIVLTYNEEAHIADCLASLAWCHEVWVVDSLSTDRTPDIAARFTSNVVPHEFEGFRAQRQWSLDNLPLQSEWVFFVDADEQIPEPLAREISARVQSADCDGYFIPMRQYFWGRLIRFGDFGPIDVLRLHRRGRGCFPEREVHELLVVDGRLGRLREPMTHIARRDMVEIIDKINKYSSLDALRMFRTGQELYTTAAKSPSRKSAILKAAFKYVPFKPLARFLYDYLVCQGFREGRVGFALAFAEMLYVYLAYFKLWELRQGIVQPPGDHYPTP